MPIPNSYPVYQQSPLLLRGTSHSSFRHGHVVSRLLYSCKRQMSTWLQIQFRREPNIQANIVHYLLTMFLRLQKLESFKLSSFSQREWHHPWPSIPWSHMQTTRLGTRLITKSMESSVTIIKNTKNYKADCNKSTNYSIPVLLCY